MRTNPKLKGIICLLLLWSGMMWSGVNAQVLQTTPNNNAAQLASTLVGNGVAIFNATLTCPQNGSGTFNANGSNIGLTSGVLLTSGDVANAIGPNNSASQTTNSGAPGDAQLSAITAPYQTYDACVLEFDMIPSCDTIQIEYVFGSEEYPEFVNGGFNDAFAFFITGPGYPVATNIALVPGTVIPVAIDNVNMGTYNCPGAPTGCTNCAYYVDNCSGTSVQYDGFTTPLFARAAVTPCATYHVKLAVADAGDGSYDSGVFLQASGTGCSSPIISINTASTNGGSLLVEGCNDYTLDFIRYGDTSSALDIQLLISGTATNGTDITYVYDSVHWDPGVDSVGYVLSAPDDGIAEGLETLLIIVSDTVCSTVFADTAEIIISDPPVADWSFVTSCAGQDVVFTDQSSFPGGAITSYFWDFGDGSSDTVQNPTHAYAGSGSYMVTLYIQTDQNCTDSLSIGVGVTGDPTAQFQFNDPCFGSPVTFMDMSYPASGDSIVSYQWTFGDGGTSNAQNPSHLYQNAGSYNVTLIVTGAFGCADTITQVVTMTFLGVDAGANASFCDGEGGAQLSAGNIVGGQAPFYYTWWCDSTNTYCGLDSIYDDDPIALPGASTWYYVQVQDSRGCTSEIDSVWVEVLPRPVADAGADLWLCDDNAPGANLQGSATGNIIAWNWSPGIGLNDSTIPNPYARPDTTTIYTLTVTSADGCTSDPLDTNATVIVHVTPRPIANGGPDRVICYEDTIMLQGIGSGAGPLYDYQWSPAVNMSDSTIPNPLVWPTLTTEYTLVVWSYGCPSYADTVRVDVEPLPTISPGWTEDICLGDTALLDPQTNNPNATFNFWPQTGIVGITPAGDLLAAPESTTVYYMQATSANGCKSAIDSITVYLLPTPHAEAGPPLMICYGDTTDLLGSYYYTTTDTAANPSLVYYNWSPSATLSDAAAASPMAWPTTSGYYYLEVTSGICSTLDSTFVTVLPEVMATAEADTGVICGGDSVQLTANGGLGGASFTWIPSNGLSDANSATPMAAPDSTTTYYVVVNEGGCMDTAMVTVDVLPMPVSAALSSFMEGCSPLTVSFLQTSTNGISYVWDFGDGTISNDPNPEHTFTEPGHYYVTLTTVGTGGCASTTDTMDIYVGDTAIAGARSAPPHPATLPMPAQIPFFEESVNGTSFFWDFGDGTTSTDANPVHSYNYPGTYFVTLTVENALGCTSTYVLGPYEIFAPGVFIPNVFSPNGDGIMDDFRVDYTGNQPYHIEIYDRWGILMFQSNNKLDYWDGTVNGTPAPEGEYYYHIEIGPQDYTGSFTLVR